MRRGKGPLGAIMDEYERAAEEYLHLIASLEPALYDSILDPDTRDKDCESVKRICFHVIFAGYGYANAIRRKFGAVESSPERFYPTQDEFPGALRNMLAYTEETLANHYSMTEDELVATNVPIRWSDHHDMEALLEHAIVHILRHRRQVESLTTTAARS